MCNINPPSTQILVIDSHPLFDGRVNRHISYINSTNGYRISRLNLVFSNIESQTDYHSYVSLYQLRFPICKINIFRRIFEFFWSLLFYKKYSVKECLEKLNLDPTVPTIIHIHDPLLLIAGKKFANCLSISRIIYDKHENYYHSSSIKDISGKVLGFMEKLGARFLDGVVIVHSSHRDSAVKLLNGTNIVEIPNYPSINNVDSRYINGKILSTSLSSELVFTYIGSLHWNSDRDIRTILYTAKNILPKYSCVRMIIGGATTDRELLHELSVLSNKYPEQFKYVGFITPKEIMEIHQKSHFGFYMIKPDTDAWVASSANKIYEYLACGMIPILRTPQTDFDDFSSCSLIFKRDDSKEFILKEIENLLNDKERIQTLMQASFELGQNYSFEAVANRYIELYDSVIK